MLTAGLRTVGRPSARWTDDLKRVAGSDWMAKAGYRVLRYSIEGLRPALDCKRLMMIISNIQIPILDRFPQ